MIVCKLDRNGVYVSHREINIFDTWMPDEVKVDAPMARDGVSFKLIDGIRWEELIGYISPVSVPQTLTPRQARLVLLQANLLIEVETLLANDKTMQIWWEYSLEIDRNHPHIEAMAVALNLTSVQLDQLFIDGAKL